MSGHRTPRSPLHLLRLLGVLLPGFALVAGLLTAPAHGATGPSLSLLAPRDAPRDSVVVLRATLTGSSGAAIAGETVRLEAAGTTVASGVTGSDGRVELSTTLAGTTTFQAVRDATADGAAITSPTRTVGAYDATTSVSLAGPASGFVDSPVTFTATLTRDDTGAAVPSTPVRLERLVNGVWKPVETEPTNSSGVAMLTATIDPGGNTFSAVYDGRYDGETDNLQSSRSPRVEVTPLKRDTELRLTGPDRVVDETSVPLQLAWTRKDNGAPVPGSVVVYRRLGDADWTRYERLTLGADGLATLRVRPRVDSRWKAVGAAGRWWKGATSAVKALDNVPPGTPVAYPSTAPRPAITLPRNARATGAGPNATVSRIGDAMWRSMVGRTWHSGCPVGRSQLRVVRVNYWGYDGYRYRGEIVLRDSVAARGAQVLSAIYRNRLPVWRMYRVDRFGWSSTLRGGDDYESMRAGNTSGFNCRGVVGNPSVPSPHSYGRSIDINTWENPYRSRQGLVPNSWWQSRSHPRIAWRSRDHLMVRTMAAHGFRWTYGTGDNHHFDG